MLTYAFTLDPHEFVRAHTHGPLRHGYLRWTNAVFITIPVVFVALSLIQGSSLMMALVTNAIWIVLAVYFAVAMPRHMRRALLDEFARNRLLHGEQRYTFGDDGIHVSGTFHTMHLEWPAIHEIIATPEFVFLRYGRHAAHFLPLRAMASPGGVEALRTLAASRISAAR